LIYTLERLCQKTICVGRFGYEYKVKLLLSRQLFYTRSISPSKRGLTPSVPILGVDYLSENNVNETWPCSE